MTAKNLKKWAGADLNRRHTDFQSVLIIDCYMSGSSDAAEGEVEQDRAID